MDLRDRKRTVVDNDGEDVRQSGDQRASNNTQEKQTERTSM